MIVLTYRFDEAEWESDLLEAPTSANSAALEQTYFLMPVRFAIDGTDLLGSPESGPWHRLPLLGVAWGFGQVSLLSRSQNLELALAGGGDLRFQRGADSIVVSSTVTHASVECDAAELRGAAEAFVASVRGEFEQRLPEMSSHAGWSTWFAR